MIDETVLLLLLSQWLIDIANSGARPVRPQAGVFLGWLRRHRFDSIADSLRNSQVMIESFIAEHGTALVDYWRSTIQKDAGDGGIAGLPHLRQQLKRIVEHTAEQHQQSVTELTEPAREILMASALFHEIALYRTQGFVLVGLTTDGERELKGVEYIHGFDELRNAGYIRHNAGRNWYFSDEGIKAVNHLQESGK